jgi:hypothetical protein
MSLTNLCISLSVLAVAGACLFILTGCTTSGKVYISHPQVFTRERLVAAREKELQFLRGALNTPVQSTFSGARDVRTLSAFQESLAVTASPTAGANVSNASPSALSDTSKLMPGGANSMDLAKGVSVSPVEHFNDQMAYRDAVNAVIREKELDDTHDRDGKTLYTLKFDTALIPGTRTRRPALVKITIQQPELQPEEIPDIYHLWLQDLEARRAEDERAIALRFDRGQITSADESLIAYLKDGLKDICRQAAEEIPAQESAPAQAWLSAAAKYTADVLAMSRESRAEYLDKIRRDLPKQTPRFHWPPAARVSPAIGAGSDEQLALLTGMTIALNAQYCKDFAGLASVKYDFAGYGQGDTVVTGRIIPYQEGKDPESFWWNQSEWKAKPQARGAEQFSAVLHKWTTSAYVDAIDPQIYAQNISDVSSQTRLMELALALNAAIAKPASLSESMKYAHQSQKFLQAIKRQPLALGFANGAAFGWLLSPPFEVGKDGNATYSQAPTRQSFSVSIVVPAWLRELNLSATQCWITEDGKEADSVDLPPCLPVTLPRDMDALTSAMQRRSARLAPTLYLTGEVLQAGAKGEQTLLVRGRELWRNPAVIVGSTPADAIDLLPDMRGLIAHFKTIPATYSNLADLTVVTSFGADSLEKSIRILAPSKAATNIQPQAKLTNTFAVYTGQPLGFTLMAMPPAFAGFSIKIGTKDTPGKWKNLADNEYQLATNRASLIIPITISPPVPATPTICHFDLGFRAAPSATPRSMFTGTNPVTFLFFPAKGQEKPTVAPATVNYTATGPSVPYLALGPAQSVTKAHLYLAYPGLEKAVTDGKATVALSQTATKTRSHPLPLRDAAGTGWTAATASLSAADLPAGTYDAFTLEYQSPGGEAETIDCTGGPVTVTGH